MRGSRVNSSKVQEILPILVLVLFIDAAHESSGRWKDFINENEDSLLRRKLNPLADHVDELAYGEVCGDKVLLLVDSSDVAFLNLFADNLERDNTLAAARRDRKRMCGNVGEQGDSAKGAVTSGGERGAHRNAVRILLTDALGLGLALLKGVLVLKLAAHLDGDG